MASSSNDSTTFCNSKDSNIVVIANNDLAVNLYKQLAAEKQNVFFSPFSISTILTMIFFGARNATAKQMQTVLGYGEADIQKENIPAYFLQTFIELENTAKASILTNANSLLFRKGLTIKNAYKSLMEKFFKALMMEADFLNEAEKVVDQINKWVKEKTNDMIPDLLDSLNSGITMVILNAIYFRGTWLYQFDKTATFLDDFYNKGAEESPKQVEMMHLKKLLPFVEKSTFKALQLPYEGERTAMLILLPHSKNGLVELEGPLDVAFLEEVRKEMVMQRVEVSLPKFRLEYSKSLKNALEILGMKSVFEIGVDLGGISDCKDLHVSEVVHKAVLEVNEEGCEAAAATALVIADCCISSDPEFSVDHPFLLLIYDLRNNLILFMGRVEEL